MNIISFVILHYKDLEITDRCVQSILRMELQEQIRIVIVDNDVQETIEYRQNIRQKYRKQQRITVLQAQKNANGGFSYANNIGYAYAREKQDASYVIVANNDIEFLQPEFPRLLERAYQESQLRGKPCHVLGPDIIRQSTGEHQNPMDVRLRTKEETDYTIRMNTMALKHYTLLYPLLFWNDRRNEKRRIAENRKREKQGYFQTVQEGIIPFGACLIFTPAFVQREEKAFTPETKFYYEEYILACRCQRNDSRILYDPALKVLHESGTATRKSFDCEKQRMRFMMERIAEACEVYRGYLEKG